MSSKKKIASEHKYGLSFFFRISVFFFFFFFSPEDTRILVGRFGCRRLFVGVVVNGWTALETCQPVGAKKKKTCLRSLLRGRRLFGFVFVVYLCSSVFIHPVGAEPCFSEEPSARAAFRTELWPNDVTHSSPYACIAATKESEGNPGFHA